MTKSRPPYYITVSTLHSVIYLNTTGVSHLTVE